MLMHVGSFNDTTNVHPLRRKWLGDRDKEERDSNYEDRNAIARRITNSNTKYGNVKNYGQKNMVM